MYGTPIFLILASKHRLWVHVPRLWVHVPDCGYMYPRTHNLCFEQNKKNIQKFLQKIFNFYNSKDLCILHGQVFVRTFIH